jgi:glutathione S-transferase
VKLELVSAELCPYVQRAVIILSHKGAQFSVRHVDLRNPPAWFQEISPTGRVPVLRVDDRVSVFESLVILEFIDETVGERLLSSDPLERARERAWMQFASSLQSLEWRYMSAETDDERAEMKSELFDDLQTLEAELPRAGGFFSGARFGLVDAAIAPFFTRLEAMPGFMQLPEWKRLPLTRSWAERILAVPAVKDSVPPDFAKRYLALHA